MMLENADGPSGPPDAEAGSGLSRALNNTMVRYAIAAIGPIGSSATQLILSLVMLRVLTPTAFGSFTFLLVSSQLSWGIWTALFCAPLPVFLSSGRSHERADGEATLLATNLVGAIVAFPLFAGMAAALGLHNGAIMCFAGYGALALLRWFARSYAYAHGRQMRTMLSDVAYSLTVLTILGLGLVFAWMEPQTICYAALLIGAAIGLLPFGRSYFRSQFHPFRWHALRRYRPIWVDQSRWALLGVVTTEATANAHVYIITLLQGPKAFAPIAAAALLLRPVNVAQNALGDFERPQMARLIGSGAWHELAKSVRIFKVALVTILGLTAIASTILFLTNPRLLFPASYDLAFVATATALWTGVALLRLWQTPASIMLQAAGEFRPLAFASVWSSIASVVAVIVIVALAGTLWSIGGLMVGAAIFLHWTQRAADKWMSGRT